MAFADDVIRVLQRAGRPLDDDAIAAGLNVVRQQVNQACRRLESRGVVHRMPGPNGKIMNELRSPDPAAVAGAVTAPAPPLARPTAVADRDLVSEDEVKAAVKRHLETDRFAVTVAWGRERGIDIEARRGDDRWVIEAKGGAPRGPQQVNYFLGALGELVQRMDDDGARYALALHDDPQYRGLVARLPNAARRRLDLTVFFVRRNHDHLVVQLDEPPETRD